MGENAGCAAHITLHGGALLQLLENDKYLTKHKERNPNLPVTADTGLETKILF